MPKKRTNIHIFFSSIENESRLMKETASLIKLGLVDHILILGKNEGHLPKYQTIDENRQIIRATMIKNSKNYGSITKKIIGLIRLSQYLFFVLWTIVKIRPAFISCHNLLLLPLGSITKVISGAKLIYTPHELETERTGLKAKVKKLAKLNEKIFIRFADKVMVVCEPIAKWYETTYGINCVFVLPNAPHNPYINKPLIRTKLLKEEFSIPDDHLIFIYQGVIDRTRGSVELIDNFKKIKKDRHLVMMGYGDTVPYLKEVSKENHNIHFKEAVDINKIIDYTSSADVGIFYIPFDISLSYRFSLPNKFYEYLIAGLPIIVSSNLEYLSNIIIKNDIGWVLPNDQHTFVAFVNSMNQTFIHSKNVTSYANNSGWQLEEKVLEEVYC